jgi:succinoglycan biosynthesis transport protein ExoP
MGRENEDNQHISSSLYHPEIITHRQRRSLKPNKNRAIPSVGNTLTDYYADDYLYADSLTNRSKRHPSHSSNIPNNNYNHNPNNLGRLWKNYPFLIISITSALTASAYLWTLEQVPQYQGNFQLLVEPIRTKRIEQNNVNSNDVNSSDINNNLNSPDINNPNFNDQAEFARLDEQLKRIIAGDIPTSQKKESVPTNKQETITSEEFDYQSQIQLLRSPQIMQPIINQLKSRYPEISYRYFFPPQPAQQNWWDKFTNPNGWQQDKLTIQRLGETKIIEVNYQDSDPAKIIAVLQTISDAFVAYSKNDHNSDTRIALETVQSKIPTLTERIKVLEEELVNLQSEYGMIDPQIASQQVLAEKQQIAQEKRTNQLELAEQQSLFTTLQNQLNLDPEQALMATALSQSPRYQELLNQLQELESKLALESSRFKEKAPPILALLKQRELLLPLLEEEASRVLGVDVATVDPKALTFQDSVRVDLIHKMVNAANDIKMLEVRQNVLNQAEQQVNQYAKKIPQMVKDLTKIKEELATNQKTLNNLQAQENSLLMTISQTEIPWETIAEPDVLKTAEGNNLVVWPKLPINLAVGGLAGFILSSILAWFLDRCRDDVFQSPREVKTSVDLPLLGVIPVDEQRLWRQSAGESFNTNIHPNTNNQKNSAIVLYPSAFQEAFRSLNTNIRLLGFQQTIKSCVISSASPGDGKSTVAVNLAQAAAAMGQKVLLVDADLRCPQIHRMMALPNTQGLTEAIAQNITFDEVIQRSPVEENLYVLTAGNIPADPMKILSAKRMQDFMEEASANFDLVILDTPPLLGRADANLLAASTDGLMLVVGLGKTEREILNLALEDLQMSGVPVLGLIGNGDKPKPVYYLRG